MRQEPLPVAGFRGSLQAAVTIHEETVHVVPEEEHLCDSPEDAEGRCKLKDIPHHRAAILRIEVVIVGEVRECPPRHRILKVSWSIRGCYTHREALTYAKVARLPGHLITEFQ